MTTELPSTSILYSTQNHEPSRQTQQLTTYPIIPEYSNEVPDDLLDHPVLIKENISSHRQLRQRIKDLEKVNINCDQIVLFFVGNPDNNGRSWHSESNVVEKAVNFMLKKLQIGGFFLKVHAGTREEWLDPENPFKKDPKIELTDIPTLCVWDSYKKKLSGKMCHDLESVYLLLKD